MRRALALLAVLVLAWTVRAADGPGTPADPRLAYVGTYAPIDATARRAVLDAAEREPAVADRRLAEIGEPARRVLASLAADQPSLEPRLAALWQTIGGVHKDVLARGLDHDVGWLAATGDAGAARLARILPEDAPRDDAVAWWALHGRSYRWDPTADRFVGAPAAAPSLRLRDRATVRVKGSAGLLSPGEPFTLEMWWRSADAGTEIYLAGDEGWPENAPHGVSVPTKCGWVLRRIPAGEGAAYLQFCAAIAPDDWWAVSSLPMRATQQWEHLAVVGTGDVVRIFRDGECVAAAPIQGRTFLASPFDVCIGPREGSRDDARWARRVSHHELRAVRISGAARYGDDFTPPATLERDAAALVVLDLTRGEDGLRDRSGHGHDGVATDPRPAAPLDVDDAREALRAIGADLGPAVVVEAESGAASADWWVSERDWMSDGFIHEIWSDRDPDAAGHWARVPFRVERAGKYRLWFLGGSLERRVGEDPFDYSPFAWRVDGGEPRRVAGGAPTVAGGRIERGLSLLGTEDLWAGEHVFDLRLLARRVKDQRWSLWFDALVVERVE